MGYAMKMGSKQKNTPTNFKEKDAMLMHEPGHIDTDPGNSLGNDVEKQTDELYDKYSSKAGSQPINQKIIMNSGESGSGYQALGGVVKNIIKPKTPAKGQMGSEAYYRQQERKADREVERFKMGKINVPSTTKDKDGNIIPNAYDNALANQKKFKNKKGTQTKTGKFLRSIFK